MNQQFICQKIHHQNRNIMGFCLNLNCTEGTSQYCQQCLQKDHTNCGNKCFEFSLLPQVFDEVLKFLEQIKNDALTKFEQAKQKFDKASKELNTIIENFQNFKANIKNQEYFPIKKSINKIKRWYYETQKEKKFSNFNYGLQLLQQKNWQEAVKQLNLDKNDVNYELAQFYRAWGFSQQNILLNEHSFIERLGGLNENLISKLQSYTNILLDQNQKNWVALITKGILLSNKREFNTSLLQFNQVLKFDNENIYCLYWKCHALINLKQLEEAQKIIIQMSQIDPNYVLRFVAEGYLLYKQEKFDKALKCYENFLEKNPNYVQVLMYKGLALLNNVQVEEAQMTFNKILEIDPNNYLAYQYLGLSLENQGRIGEALSCYDQAINLDQNFHEAYLKKSQALKKLGSNQEAEKTLDELIKKDPNYTKAYLQKGLLLQSQFKYKEAIAHYTQVELSGFVDAQIFYNHGFCLFEQKKYGEAVKFFKLATQHNKNEAKAYYLAGKCLIVMNNQEEAIQQFIIAQQLDPNLQYIHFFIGCAYYGLFQYKKAVESLQQAIKQNYGHADAHFFLGLTLLKQKKYEEATIYFDEAININKSHFSSYVYKGHALQKNKSNTIQLQLVMKTLIYKKSIMLQLFFLINNNNNNSTQYTEKMSLYLSDCSQKKVGFEYIFLGQILYEQGKYEKALESFSQISKIDPKYVNAYNYSGLALCKMKRIEEGMKQFEYAITIKPHFPLSYVLRDYFNNKAKEFKPKETIERLKAIFSAQPKTQLQEQQIQLLIEMIGSQEEINYENEVYLEEIIKICKRLQKLI